MTRPSFARGIVAGTRAGLLRAIALDDGGVEQQRHGRRHPRLPPARPDEPPREGVDVRGHRRAAAPQPAAHRRRIRHARPSEERRNAARRQVLQIIQMLETVEQPGHPGFEHRRGAVPAPHRGRMRIDTCRQREAIPELTDQQQPRSIRQARGRMAHAETRGAALCRGAAGNTMKAHRPGASA